MTQGMMAFFVTFTWIMASFLFWWTQPGIRPKGAVAVLLLAFVLVLLFGVSPLSLRIYSLLVIISGLLVLMYPDRISNGIFRVVFLLVLAGITFFMLQTLVLLGVSWSLTVFGFLLFITVFLSLFRVGLLFALAPEDAGMMLLLFGVFGAALPGFLASWEKAQRLLLVRDSGVLQSGPGMGVLCLGCFGVFFLGILFQFRKGKR